MAVRCKGLAGSLLVAVPIALLMLAALAGTATAANAGLSNPVVNPRQVNVGDSISLSVTYTDSSDSAPLAISVQVGTRTVAMAAQDGSYATGTRFAATMAMSVAGVLQVSFRATDAAGLKHVQWSGFVHVDGPATPTTPPAPPGSSPTPVSGAGGGGSGGKSAGGDEGGSGGPVPTPVSGGASTPAPRPSEHPAAPTQRPVSVQPTPGAVRPPTSGTTGKDQPAGPTASPEIIAEAGSHTDDAPGGISPKSGTDVSQGAIVVGPSHVDLLADERHASLPTLVDELRPTIVTLATGTGAWAAFVLFGKRRRDGDQPAADPALAAAAATSYETTAAAGLHVIDESQLPRWRRPSLQQIRKADPLRAVAAESSVLSFESAGVRPLESYERRRIRYRLVRLLDSPDEVRATEIGVLDRNDEVQLLQRYGAYWEVLCPDGRTGWLHRMTLSDPEWDSPPQLQLRLVPTAGDGYQSEAPEPIAVQPASSASDSTSDGLLEAYIRARSEAIRVEPAAEVDWSAVRPVVRETVDFDEPDSEEAVATEPAGAVAIEPAEGPWEEDAVLRAVDYLERAGFAVSGPSEDQLPDDVNEAPGPEIA